MFRIIAALCLLVLLSAPAVAENASSSPARAAPMVVPTNDPGMDDAAVMSWAALAVNDFLTYSHEDQERRFQQSSAYFTPTGWQNFMEAMKKSHVIDSVVSQKQTSTAHVTSPPVIVQKGVLDGRYRWIVSVPITISYKSAVATRLDTLQLTLVVERTSEEGSIGGVGIAQFIAQVSDSPAMPYGSAGYQPPGRLMGSVLGPSAWGAVDQPGVEGDALLIWAAAAATRAGGYSFVDYEESFVRLQRDFTPGGWTAYHDAIVSSGTLKNVIENQLLIKIAPLGKPSITQQGEKEGAYQWTVSMPVVRTIRVGRKKESQQLQLTLGITRVKDYPGLAISSWQEAK